MPFRHATACIMAVALILLAPLSARAITIGQIDTFEDETLQGWMTGFPNPVPPVNIATGGPAGANDNYMQLTSTGEFGPGGKLTAFNLTQWTGDYTAVGVTSIRMAVKNFGTTALSLRLGFFSSVVARAISTNAISVPAGSGWTTIEFPVIAASLTTLVGTTSGALANVTEVRILHNTAAAFPGPDIQAQLGVDNIEALGGVSVAGTLTFEDIVATAPAQSVTFTFRPASGSPFSRTLSVPANGAFTITGVPPGMYTLHIKSAKHLAENRSVNATSNVTGVTATLRAADADNNNIVDVNDLAALITSFDARPSSSNWIGGVADFDGDLIVSVDDLDLIVRNFDARGAN